MKNTFEIPIVLSDSLTSRKPEFNTYLGNAITKINLFAQRYGWNKLVEESFMDSYMVFDNRKDYDKKLSILSDMDENTEFPVTYCGALEKRILITVSPEMYADVYPQGIEERSYEKLLTHEIAHRLHIRILNGDEDAMGPIWFYEGFAIFAADQFSKSDIILNPSEISKIINNPNRISYLKYGNIIRYFVKKIPLHQLIEKAKEDNFNEWLFSKLAELNR